MIDNLVTNEHVSSRLDRHQIWWDKQRHWRYDTSKSFILSNIFIKFLSVYLPERKHSKISSWRQKCDWRRTLGLVKLASETFSVNVYLAILPQFEHFCSRGENKAFQCNDLTNSLQANVPACLHCSVANRKITPLGLFKRRTRRTVYILMKQMELKWVVPYY